MIDYNNNDILTYLKTIDAQCVNEDALSDGIDGALLNSLMESFRKKLTWMCEDDMLYFAYDVIGNLRGTLTDYISSVAVEGFIEAVVLDDDNDTILKKVYTTLEGEE